MAPDWSLDVAIAPAGAIARISAAINRKSKRAFGILKTENEYIGLVRDLEFEIWERQQRAIHALGEVRGRRGGSRIEVRFHIRPLTRALIAAFFGLYVLASAGIALRPPESEISVEKLAIGLAGGLVLAMIFAVGARRQRADLRRFVEGVFGDVTAN